MNPKFSKNEMNNTKYQVPTNAIQAPRSTRSNETKKSNVANQGISCIHACAHNQIYLCFHIRAQCAYIADDF